MFSYRQRHNNGSNLEKMNFVKCLREIVQSTLVFPLTAGNKRSGNGVHDGRIATIICVGYFSKFKFRGSLRVHYGMIFVVAANLEVWMFSFLNASKNLFKSQEKDNSTYYPYSDCNGTTEMEKTFFRKVYPYMSTFFVEYTLLVISCILGMWSSTADGDEVSPNHVTTNIQNENCENENGESRQLLQTETGSSETSVLTLTYYVTLILGMMLIIPLIIGALVLILTDESVETFYFDWVVYKLSYSLVLLVVNLAAFHKLREDCQFIRAVNSFNGNDFVLLICTFVDVIFQTFGVLAGAFQNDSASKIVASYSIVFIIIDYLQTTFIMQAKRYDKTEPCQSVVTIGNICLFLTVLNVGSWIVDSLIGLDLYNIALIKFIIMI
ncbi:hypothetical protein KUTeg_010602 [Tegillarca granosa]|uniref:Uncharacterized protein n=1 Tax=Tegillarca granosa TaxID=220873 RepID=A0ABQ9F6L1_TEGGR|nr:hypothetical protein KUTeg_010602 [Tegillarca granosa]